MKIATTLEEHLAQDPWKKEWSNLAKPIESFWKFSLPVSASEMWPYLIDTSSFNRSIGVPEMKYVEKNGRLYGTSKNAGILMEWEEIPWEWEFETFLGVIRVYSKGIGHVVRSKYYVQKTSAKTIDLFVYFGWIPRGFLGKLILPLGMKQLQKDYQKGLDIILGKIDRARELKSQEIVPFSVKALDEKAMERLKDFKPKLQKLNVNQTAVNRLFALLESGTEDDLYKLKVKKYAKDWNLKLDQVIPVFLEACRIGLLTLSWDVVCPHCKGVRKEATSLGDVPENGSCEVCDVEFSAMENEALEVSFHVHSSLAEIGKRFFCAAEPSTKQHIFLQKTLSPKETFEAKLEFPEGTYRVRKRGDKKYNRIELEKSNPNQKIAWNLSSDLGIDSSSTTSQLVLENPFSETTQVIMESKKEDQDILRPGEIFNYSEFRDIFSEESIRSGLKLDIGTQTILFTDIVGSTKFYISEGDNGAFSRIKIHFEDAFKIISGFRGTVVKTIGDSVMAAFSHPIDALEASISLQKNFEEKKDTTGIRIRISFHQGSCLAVNLDTNIDYFGSTVNYAAKLQAMADAAEITFSEEVFRDLEVREYLKEHGLKLRKRMFALSGSKEEKAVYTLGI